MAKHANMWRMTGDFWDEWDKLHNMFEKCREWQGVSKKKRWPDCDMLPLGILSKNAPCHGSANRKTNFTKPEQITMMTLWGIFRSPLFFGGNMPENDDWTLSLLNNSEYLKMHRSSFGAKEILNTEKNGAGTIVWASNAQKAKYIAIFNTENKKKRISFNLNEILMNGTPYSALDIWNKKTSTVKNRLTAEIEPHGAALFKIEQI